MKSEIWSSTTGRAPTSAAPTPAPEMAASEIGESITRAGPNSASSPSVTLNRPPCRPMSSPITKTRVVAAHLLAERLVQRLRHRQLACRDRGASSQPAVGVPLARRVDVRHAPPPGPETASRARSRPPPPLRGPPPPRARRRARAETSCRSTSDAGEADDRVARAPERELLRRPVVVRRRGRMRRDPVRLRLDQRRPVAGAGARDRPLGRLADGEEVVAVDDLARKAVAGRPDRRCPARSPRPGTASRSPTGCSRRRRPPARRGPRPGSPPRGRCPDSTRRRRRTRRPRRPSPAGAGRTPRRLRSRPSPATIASAPSMPWRIAVMCMLPPLPPQ